MATGLIDIIKRASMDAIDNAQMCDLRVGTVVSTSPLKVKVSNVFTVPSNLLIVPQHLTKYNVSVKLSGTEEQVLEIHNELKTGDRVALLRKQGGQSYFILDRI
jgi:hypothetical protein